MSSERAKQCPQSKAVSLSRIACCILASLALTTSSVFAGPRGGNIAAGQGSISTYQSSTLIQQLSNNLIIDWQSFNIAANELVRFNQPSSSAAALNRINNQLPSEIFGSLQANGLVFLMNPNGVIFGESASVQVGGLVATNLEVDANLFMQGNYNLESLNASDGLVINRGLIAASTGGVSLISDTGVINEGKILASYGSVNLAAGTSATLDFDGDKLLQLSVDGEVLQNALSLDAAVTNSGEIIAEGGEVILTGSTARDIFTNVVNNTGIIKATAVDTSGGVVRLVANGGNISHSGAIDVSTTTGKGGHVTIESDGDTLIRDTGSITATSSNGAGGTVHVLGNRVGLFDQASIDASGTSGGGEILIGGDYQGSNPDIQNAEQSFVSKDSVIRADATNHGDGGRVIVWSDNLTQFYGELTARQSGQDKNGGFAEISGKISLDISGFVDLGQDGNLLLDPRDVTIRNNGTATLDQINEFSDGTSTTDRIVDDGTIESVLSAGTNVIIQANRDIHLDDRDINNVTGTGDLIMMAGDDITFDNGQDIILAGGDLVLSAGDSGATLTADDTADITLNGTIDLGGGRFYAQTNTVSNSGFTVTGGTITTDASIITASEAQFDAVGNVDVNTDAQIVAANSDTGTITIDSTYVDTTDDFTIGSVSTYNDDAAITVNGISGLTTSDQSITVTSSASDLVVDQAINAGAAAVSLTTSTHADAHRIFGAGLISSNGLTVDSDARIQIVTSTVNGSAISLTAGGTARITMVESNDIVASDLTVATDAGAQVVDLSANSWTLDADIIGNTEDTLVLRATGADGTGGITGATVQNAGQFGFVAANNNSIDVDINDATVVAASAGTGSIQIDSVIDTGDASGSLEIGTVTSTDGGDVSGLSTTDNTITVNSTDADINITQAISSGTGSINLTTTEVTNTGDYDIGGAGTLSTSGGTVTVNADGGINTLNTVIDDNAGAGGALNITTAGSTTAGDITVVDTGNTTIDLSGVATAGDAQTISLTSGSGWNITSNAGDATDTISIIATTGDIDRTGSVTVTALDLTLTATAGGIGTSLTPIRTNAGDLTLTSGGTGNAGDIYIDDSHGSAVDINVITTDAASGQVVSLIGDNGWILKAANVGGSADTFSFDTAAGDISDDTAGAGGNLLTASAAAFKTTGAGTIDMSTHAATIAAGTGSGDIRIDSLYEAADNTGAIAVGAIGTVTGISTTGAITITSEDADINITENISAGASIISITTTENDFAGDYNIGGAATVSTTGGLTVEADGGIGTADVGGTLNTDLDGGNITLTSHGNDAAGNITVTDTGNAALTLAGLTSDGTGSQTIDLESHSWSIGGAIGDAADTLILRANTGGISDGDAGNGGAGSVLTAAALGFEVTTAGQDIDVTTDAATVAASAVDGNIFIESEYDAGDNTGVVTVGSVGGINGISTNGGNINVTVDDADINVTQAIAAGVGTVSLMTTETDFVGDYNIGSTGVISTTGGLTIEADGGIGTADVGSTLSTDLDGGSITLTSHGNDAAGNITVTDTGNAALTLAGLTSDGTGSQTIDLESHSWSIGGAIGDAADSLVLRANTGGITDGDVGNGGAGNILTAAALAFEVTAAGQDIDVTTDAATIAASANDGNIFIESEFDAGDNTGTVTVGSVSGINGISTNGGNINLTADDADIDITQNISSGAGTIDISTTETDFVGDYNITRTGAFTITTASTLTLSADGGIGTSGTPLLTDAATLILSTAAANAAGDIYISDNSLTSLGAISTNAVATFDAQTIDITTNGDLNVTSSFGDAADTIVLTASTGDVDRTGAVTVTASDLTLEATAGGIGTSPAAPMLTAAGTLTLTSGGANAAGDIYVSNTSAGATSLGVVTTDAATGQTVDLVADNGWNLTASNVGGTNDSVSLTASIGNIEQAAGTLSANSLTLIAANGGIGTLGTINTATSSLDVSALAPNISGNIDISNTNAGATTLTGVTTQSGCGAICNQFISLSTNNGWDLNGAIGDDRDVITISTTNGNVRTVGGSITADTLDVSSTNGGIGIGGALDATANAITLTTGGSNATGDIFFTTTGAFNVSAFSGIVTTDAGTGQTIELSADSWVIDGATIGDANDSLVLNALTGGFTNLGTLTAAAIGLSATGVNNIDVTTDAATVAATTGSGSININSIYNNGSNTGVLMVGSVGTVTGISTTNNSITLTSTNADINIAQDISAGNGSINLTTTENILFPGDYNIGGAGTVSTTGTLTVNADGGIGTPDVGALNTDLDGGSLSLISAGANAAGDITVVDAGSVAAQLATLSTDFTTDQTVNLTAANGWGIPGVVGNSQNDDSVTLIATNGDIFTDSNDLGFGCCSAIFANDLVLIASNGAIGGRTTLDQQLLAFVDNSITLTSGGTGNIRFYNAGVSTVLNSVTTAAGAHVIDITSQQNLTVNGNIGDIADDVTLTTINGGANILRTGGTINANILNLDAAGGIGIGGTVITNANSLNLATTGADTSGNITLIQNGDLNTSNVTVTTSGSNASTLRTVDLTANSWVIDGSFNVGDNNLNLTSTEANTANPHGIFNAGGVDRITAAQTLTLTSATGIGTNGSPIAVTAGGISLNTTGAGADGDIYVDGSGSNLGLGSVSTDGSTQTVSLIANSWTLTGNVDFGTDLLSLTSSVGAISDGANFTLTAGSIALDSNTSINMSTVTPNIEATANGNIIIDSTYSAGDLVIGGIGATVGVNTQNNQNITITSTNANIDVSESIDSGNGTVNISTTNGDIITNATISSGNGSTSLTTTGSGDIGGGSLATVIARGGLTASAADGINLVTDLGSGVLNLSTSGVNAAGNISLSDVGASTVNLNTAFTNTTGGQNAQTVNLTAANGWNVTGTVGSNGDADTTTLIASTGNIRIDSSGCCGVIAQDLTLTASAGGIGEALGVGTELFQIVADSLTVTTGAAGLAGSVYIQDFNATDLTLNGVTTVGDGQIINLGAGAGLNINGAVGDNLDTVTLTSGAFAAGDIYRTSGTVNADSLSLIANSGGIGIGGTVQTAANTINVSSSGAGSAGDITLVNTNAGTTTLSSVSTSGTSQTIDLTATNGWDVGGAINVSGDSMTLTANNGDIDNSAGTITADSLTLTATNGGIGITNTINSTVNALALTAGGDNAAGNITVVNSTGLFTGNVTVTTGGAGTQVVNLTALNWTVGDGFDAITADFDVLGDDLTLTASSGSINDDGDGNNIIAANLTMTAINGGIGNSIPVNTDIDGGTLTLTSTAPNLAGNIRVNDSGNAAVDLAAVNTAGSTQLIQLTSDQGWNILNGSSVGDTADTVTITANSGDIEQATGTLAVNNLTLTASSGGIGLLGAINAAANSIALTTGGTNANGNINLVNAGGLVVGNGGSETLTVSTSGATTQTLNLTADSWTVDGTFDAGNDDLNLTTPLGGGGIFNLAGGAADNITTTGDVALDSNTGIGAAGAGNAITVVNVNALTLNTAGVGAAGDIYIVGTGALNLGTGISTDASAQTISLESASWSLTADIDFTSDNFILNATGGDINGNGNTIIADSVGLSATGNIDADIDAQTIASSAGGTTNIDNFSNINTGDVIIGTVGTIVGVTGTGSVTLTSEDASIDIQQQVRSTTSDVSITTTDTGFGDYNISGPATVTAFNNLTINADGGIGVSGANPLNVDAGGSLSITSNGTGAAGDIFIASASNLSLGAVSTDDSGQIVDLSAVDWTIGAPVDFGGNTLVLRASGNISDGTNGLGGNQITAASIGFDAGGTIDVTTNAPLIATNSGGSTRIDSNYSGAGSLSIGTVSGISGITTSNSSLRLTSADDVSIDDNINTGSGNITMSSTATISESTATITTSGLATFVTDGGLTLNNVNRITRFAATNTTSGDIVLNDNRPTLTLAGISQSGGGDVIITNTGRIVTSGDTTINNNGDLGLNAGDDITIGSAVTANNIDLISGGVVSQNGAGTLDGNILTTSSSGGTTLSLNNTINTFNATDGSGGDIILVDRNSLNVSGISTTGDVDLTSGTIVDSGPISAGLLTTNTDGGLTLTNNVAVSAFTATDTAGGDISLANNGTLDLRSTTTGGAINIEAITGDINQTEDVTSSGGGDITVTSTAGALSMTDGTTTSTTGGSIMYQASGNINVSLIDAAFGTTGNVGTIDVQSDSGNVLNTDTTSASVRGNTVNITACTVSGICNGGDIGTDQEAFVLSSEIQGTITLSYTGSAYIDILPDFNVELDIVDRGAGFINSGAARSAGTQRSQSSGLEDVGFIDLALFSDINLFVVDGIGITLPADQSDISPSERQQLEVPDNIPVEDDDEEEKRLRLDVSAAY